MIRSRLIAVLGLSAVLLLCAAIVTPGTAHRVGPTLANTSPNHGARSDDHGQTMVPGDCQSVATTPDDRQWYVTDGDPTKGGSLYLVYDIVGLGPLQCGASNGNNTLVVVAAAPVNDPNCNNMLGAVKTGPDNTNGLWSLYFTQTLNGTAAAPTFSSPVVASQHFTHKGSIQTVMGGQCGDRTLGDFLQLRIGQKGEANISYSDSNNIDEVFAPHAMFVRQIGGTSVFSAVGTVTGTKAPVNTVTDPSGDGRLEASTQTSANQKNLDILSSMITKPDATHYRVTMQVADLASLAPDPTMGNSDTTLIWQTQWLTPSPTNPSGGANFMVYMESQNGAAPTFWVGQNAVELLGGGVITTYVGDHNVRGPTRPPRREPSRSRCRRPTSRSWARSTRSSTVAEGVSWLRAFRQTRADAREQGMGFREFIRESKDPTVKTVLFEDSGALTGIAVAFAGVGLSQLTGAPAFDPVASILIGCLLAYIAFRLGRNTKGLLLGEAARPDDREKIRRAIEGHEGVDRVIELLTMVLGPESLLVASRADLGRGLSSDDVERLAEEADRLVRSAVPSVTFFFLDPTPPRGADRELARGR